MKKVLSLVLLVFAITMTACVASTTETTTATVNPTTTTTSQEPTTSTDAQTTTTEAITTTTSFIAIYSATAESEMAVFNVQIDALTVDGSRPVITVRVDIVAKVDIDGSVGTSSYGYAGILGIRIVSVDNPETELFCETYGDFVNCMMLDVHIDAGGTLIRQLQFARTPFDDWLRHEGPSPVGTYKVQVKLSLTEALWIDTGILVTVTD